ncbi:zf-TFIIB domain-containing protein [Candidatus Roizmanbacteria bacterium]|jgi:DNA-directed RNA polymerase subunit M/transcription elongation factor TFIIS|nr:zf-TFIIB domain-containing protein [Candidatus Roizmanbacteria bacterium]
MQCPNCHQSLNLISLDNQPILHCSNCGASFFAENSINRITLKSAEALLRDKKYETISGEEKKCPKDGSRLAPINNEETVPQSVVLLRCSKCHGIFVFPDDLIQFKKAQGAKIDFFKLWGKPLPALKTILVLSFIFALSLSVASNFNTLMKDSSPSIQAADLVKKVYFSQDNGYLFIYFKTQMPVRSEIILNEVMTGKKITKTVSSTPKTVHQITTRELNLNTKIYYQIIVYRDDNQTSRTKWKLITF